MTDLTEAQKAYNVAQSELFQLAAYGHCRYTPRAEMLTAEGKAEQADYNDRIRQAREQLEAALLRLVAERAESFRGDWGIPAAWLRSLADDPAAVSLMAVRPDELRPEGTPTARCPAAHREDPTPCDGPAVVTVLDAGNAGADGCEHHGARLLASLEGGRVYALPDAPDGVAIRVFKAADTTRPFGWYEGAPRTEPSMLSLAENRARQHGGGEE